MGLLADFIVATETEARSYEGDATFPERYRAQLRGFTEIELGTLYHIAQGKPVAEDTLYDFYVIRSVDGGERMTTEVIPDLVNHLAAASDADLAAWAKEWCQTEELLCDAGDVLPVLEDLRRLSKLAVSERKSVYLWNCV